MPNNDTIVRAEHVAIVGDSGGGKSTVARKVHEDTPAKSVVCNYAQTDGYSGPIVDGKKAITEAHENGDVADYRDPTQTPMQHAATCMAYAREANHPVQVVFEEAQVVMHQGESDRMQETNPVWWALHQGRDKGIKVVLITQDPGDMPKPPTKQVTYWAWCGPPAGFHNGWLSHSVGNWMPTEDFPDKPHHYTVFDKQGRVHQRATETPA